MTISDEVTAVRDRLEELEEGPAVIGDWHRLEARIVRALVAGVNQLAAMQRGVRIETLRAELDELCLLRLVTQARLLELAADARQPARR